MREHKYRSWDAPAKEFIYFELEEGCIVDEYIPGPLCEYTGLKDKNGIEIYEGDSLEHPQRLRFTVEWIPAHAGFRAVYSQNDDSLLGLQIGDKGGATVIGNIYENPELLNKADLGDLEGCG